MLEVYAEVHARGDVPSLRGLRVLAVGETQEPSAPMRTLVKALEPLGIEIASGHGRETGPAAEWLDALRGTDLILGVFYHQLSLRVVRRMALAAMRGRPVLRWWVGSDVWYCLREVRTLGAARRLDRVVSLNIAVAPHLTRELESVGIRARWIPSVLDPLLRRITPVPTIPKSVLVYLPTDRKSFYGAELVRRAVEANPDLSFTIVADEAHELASFPNVRSLGWVEDMAPVLAETGCLLRITEHDGLPRMVLESLLRGHYVIYRWSFPGCWQATRVAEVQALLDRFKQASEPNHAGRAAALDALSPDPAETFARALGETVRSPRALRRIVAAGAAGWWTIADRLGFWGHDG